MRASTALETLRPIHIKIWKSHSCKMRVWNKDCLTLKINHFIFIKHIKTRARALIKLFSNILERLFSPVHVDEEYKGYNK